MRVASEVLLSELTEDLQKSLPPCKPQSLWTPLAFACVLHLASGKNLKLEGTEDIPAVLVKTGD